MLLLNWRMNNTSYIDRLCRKYTRTRLYAHVYYILFVPAMMHFDRRESLGHTHLWILFKLFLTFATCMRIENVSQWQYLFRPLLFPPGFCFNRRKNELYTNLHSLNYYLIITNLQNIDEIFKFLRFHNS